MTFKAHDFNDGFRKINEEPHGNGTHSCHFLRYLPPTQVISRLSRKYPAPAVCALKPAKDSNGLYFNRKKPTSASAMAASRSHNYPTAGPSASTGSVKCSRKTPRGISCNSSPQWPTTTRPETWFLRFFFWGLVRTMSWTRSTSKRYFRRISMTMGLA